MKLCKILYAMTLISMWIWKEEISSYYSIPIVKRLWKLVSCLISVKQKQTALSTLELYNYFLKNMTICNKRFSVRVIKVAQYTVSILGILAFLTTIFCIFSKIMKLSWNSYTCTYLFCTSPCFDLIKVHILNPIHQSYFSSVLQYSFLHLAFQGILTLSLLHLLLPVITISSSKLQNTNRVFNSLS